MAQNLPVIQLGHPTIRQVAEPIEEIAAAEVQLLVDDLLLTVAEAKGMGIAAPQVDVSKRCVVVCCHPNERYPYAPDMPPTPMLNPRITWHSESKEKDWEGCLSLPGVRALVPRYSEIEVAYQNRSGDHETVRMAGFLARVAQHELDHLDGLVFIDRVESTLDIVMEAEWRKIIADRH